MIYGSIGKESPFDSKKKNQYLVLLRPGIYIFLKKDTVSYYLSIKKINLKVDPVPTTMSAITPWKAVWLFMEPPASPSPTSIQTWCSGSWMSSASSLATTHSTSALRVRWQRR